MSTPTPPRIALCNGNVNITWSDGTLFNGFALVNLKLPSSGGGTDWAEIDYGNIYPSVKLPLMQIIPIVGGQYNTSVGLWVNADLVPPGSKYRLWVYDTTKRQIAGPTPNFTVPNANAIDPIALGGGLTLTIPVGLQVGTTPDT